MRRIEVLRRGTRTFLGTVGRSVALLIPLLNLLALVGFLARDRTLALAFLMYLPLLPIGLATCGLGFLHRRVKWPGFRGFLIATGLCSVLLAAWWMIGRGVRPSEGKGHEELTLLHWNVLWGSFWKRHDFLWQAMVGEIVRRDPDILVLSEAPPLGAMYHGFERLPGRRFQTSVQAYDPTSHSYHLLVLARWPVRLERHASITHGAAAVLVVDHPDRPIRLMLVDGQSQITRLRTPMIHDIARTCASAYGEGKPIDLVVGDYNAVSRSIGFDALEVAGDGYDLASRSHPGWRGTWPFPLPLLDIDHVWVRSAWKIDGCELFSSPGTDHRGQFVRLKIPET